MNIKEAVFKKSVSINSKAVYFDDNKEIVFIGRSNVGKSSLMNSIFNTKNLVKTSSKPGSTRLANIFVVNKKIYMTDLPGYGFAKRGKEEKEKLDALISWYLEERAMFIKKAIILIDSKIGPQESDIEMFNYIQELSIKPIIVLNKIDKLNTSGKTKTLAHAKEIFFGQDIITYSSIKGENKKELINKILENLD